MATNSLLQLAKVHSIKHKVCYLSIFEHASFLLPFIVFKNKMRTSWALNRYIFQVKLYIVQSFFHKNRVLIENLILP